MEEAGAGASSVAGAILDGVVIRGRENRLEKMKMDESGLLATCLPVHHILVFIISLKFIDCVYGAGMEQELGFAWIVCLAA